MRPLFLLALALLVSFQAYAVPPSKKTLPIGLAPHEIGLRAERQSATAPPPGEIRSLPEWEEADAVMTLWTNPSLIRELGKRGKVKLIADGQSEVSWWKEFLTDNKIPAENYSFLVVPTDSMWIRDYGPWFILDGNRTFSIVDNNYNRPRPQDDVVPAFLAKNLGVPFYHTGLTHTGGNYYNDGAQSAFSSTLVYRENGSLSSDKVNERMKQFLGIARYTTSPLGVKATIEHIDTFGKLVSPDTWVFAEFATTSRFYNDAENMVAKLKTLKSAYGTPYKIFRLKMWNKGGSENYRAYLNSFISNGALYFPKYGNETDPGDQYAQELYAQALPGYDIVGVDALDTSWGDSVHCRNRNLLKKDTIFLFPEIVSSGPLGYGPFTLSLEVVLPSGTKLMEPPQISWSWKGTAMGLIPFSLTEKNGIYQAVIPEQSGEGQLEFFITAKDDAGRVKTAPLLGSDHPVMVSVPIGF